MGGKENKGRKTHFADQAKAWKKKKRLRVGNYIRKNNEGEKNIGRNSQLRGPRAQDTAGGPERQMWGDLVSA